MKNMSENDFGTLKELRFLETGYELVLIDYEIKNVLNNVSSDNLKSMEGDVTGVVVKFDDSGTEFAEVWATDSAFAPSLNAVYERVR